MRPDPVHNGAFAQALLAPEQPPPDGLTSRDGHIPTRRFAVYRNNVVVSLVDAMASIFPTVQNLVGEDFFRAMARLYVTGHPPTSPLLFTYGKSLPTFLETFAPAADLPFLPDVARVERLWLDAYHAADTRPLDPAALAQVRTDELAGIRFTPHSATRLAQFSHAAGTIVRRDRATLPLDGVNPMASETVLLTRPDCDPAIEVLPAGGAAFFQALLSGAPLGEACFAAQHMQGDIPALIGLTLSSGAFSSIHLPNDTKQEGDRP
ncbi:HvfC/BufC N-terminal domain-containing protein [Peteryoungia algae]|uniref:DNA-binding domain-containing protein n=1 Tax=Peteryoungia algae TaxID=2919917 RepID=A0ABT0CYK4_9HYPH|nr:DNA-binding domain-containing protein [Rhizobium sp. SSM4.3]MCJ8238230.1 DNA-binding domain-containing protein [Rhizobium sp. SSM4.3]